MWAPYLFWQHNRTEVGKLAGERASLLKKLVEVEMDGKAAGEQLVKLRDTVRKLKEVFITCLVLSLYLLGTKWAVIGGFSSPYSKVRTA